MKKLLPWLSALVVIFVTFSVMYTRAQQSQQYDNYPQNQVAQDMASGLSFGGFPVSAAAGKIVDPPSLVLLEFAGTVTLLLIVYLIGTMPTRKQV